VAAAPPAADLELTCHPNPFNPQTTLSFAIPAPGHASLAILDVAGRAQRRLRGAGQGGVYTCTKLVESEALAEGGHLHVGRTLLPQGGGQALCRALLAMDEEDAPGLFPHALV
jgi:hypothetical protein